MRKSQKFMLTSLLLAVIAILTVAPTISWLSSTSPPVINTFAGGLISSWMRRWWEATVRPLQAKVPDV